MSRTHRTFRTSIDRALAAAVSAEEQRQLQFLSALKQRVTALESQQNFAIQDGAGHIRIKGGLQADGSYGLWMFENAGNVLLRIGDQGDGTLGIAVHDSSGNTSFLADNLGPALPQLAVPTRVLAQFTPVTSGTFVSVTAGTIELLLHNAVRTRITWANDAGTTGEVRIREVGSGATTSAVATGAGTSGDVDFHWLHGQTLFTDPHVFVLEARRTGGAGNCNIYGNDGGLVFYRGDEMLPPATNTGI